jgi:hypothetical protein
MTPPPAGYIIDARHADIATRLSTPGGIKWSWWTVGTRISPTRVEIDEDTLDALRDLHEDLDGSITEDDEYGIQVWIAGDGYTITPVARPGEVLDELGLDMSEQDLVDIISTDPALWDEEAGYITDAGVGVLRAYADAHPQLCL